MAASAHASGQSTRPDDGSTGKFQCGMASAYLVRAKNYYGTTNDVPYHAVKLCDHYGIDGDAILYCMNIWLNRCFKAGVLSDENTGIPLSKMGSLEFVDSLVKKIACREGFGDVLASGIHEAAKIVGKGSDAFIGDFTVKAGQNSAYCPRMYLAHAMIWAIEPRQAIQQLHELSFTLFDWLDWVRKTRNSSLDSEVMRKIAKRFWGSEAAADFTSYEGKALAAVKVQNRQYAKESLILCDLMWPVTYIPFSKDHVGDPSLESKLLSAVTGTQMSEEELYGIGERIMNLQRAIHIRDGRGAKAADVLPETMFSVPLKATSEDPDCWFRARMAR